MTVCKKRMYTKYPQILIDYFHPQHMDTMVNYETVKSWVKENTHNRSTLFMRLSHKTQGATNQYPCNSFSGDDIGKPCSFPLFFQIVQLKLIIKAFVPQAPTQGFIMNVQLKQAKAPGVLQETTRMTPGFWSMGIL